MADSGIDAADVKGLGLTGQMHGLVLLDENETVLRPAILWNDQRTGDECDEIREIIGKERLIQITGNDALTGFTAPKILWVKEQRARNLCAGEAHFAAKGLCAAEADWRACNGQSRWRGHDVV